MEIDHHSTDLIKDQSVLPTSNIPREDREEHNTEEIIPNFLQTKPQQPDLSSHPKA